MPANLRHIYACNACKGFVERYGGLLSIDDEGQLHAALWGEAPPGFEHAFALLAGAATGAELRDVLVPATAVLGTPRSPPTATGKVWSHLAVTAPRAR